MIVGATRRLWQWRGFILETVRRDFAARHAGAAGGAVWHFVQPVVQILIYVLVFSQVMQARLPGSADTLAYGLFICAGLLPWQLFSDTVTRATGMFIEYGPQIKKSAFPRSSLLLAIMGSALLNFAIVWGFFMVVLLLVGRFPGAVMLAAVPVLALLALLAGALGLLLGVLNAYLRDVGALVATAMPLLFWLTPIVWPLSIVPAEFHAVLLANPLAGLMGAMQSIVVAQQAPDWASLWPSLGIAAVVAALAVVYYRKLSPGLADQL